jgi:hypothetical protein
MWLVNGSATVIKLATGELFRAAKPRRGVQLLKTDPIRIGVEFYPLSKTRAEEKRFLCYEEGYEVAERGESVVSWIGGNIALDDEYFIDLMLNLRQGRLPTRVRIQTDDLPHPIIKYGVEIVHWDNSSVENRFLRVLDVEFTYSILKERFLMESNET